MANPPSSSSLCLLRPKSDVFLLQCIPFLPRKAIFFSPIASLYNPTKRPSPLLPSIAATATTDTTVYFRYHMRVILVCRILRCSWKMPYMSASLVGGQPGT